MKEYRKLIIATTLITLLPILLGLILWNRLPDTVAVHWGADGQADGWAGKAYAVFGLPCLLAAIHLFAVLFTLNDPRRKNINKKPLMLVFWLIPVLSLVTNGIVYLTAMGADIDVFVICFVLIGIVRVWQLYAQTSAELYRGHKDALDAEQHRELEPHTPAGRQAFYRRRYPDDPRRIQRRRSRRGRLPHSCVRDHSLMRCDSVYLFLLAVPQRDLKPSK